MLKEYIESVVSRVIADKAQRGVAPASCSLTDLVSEFVDDATEIMRSMYMSGLYEGHTDKNKIPMLTRKPQER